MGQNKKIIFIPGWMNSGGMYAERNKLYEVLGVWESRIELENKIDADYIVGHSLGCNWALLSWEKNKKTKLILVNPLLPKRKMTEWFHSWREFHKKEIPPKNKKVVSGMKNFWFGIKICWKLLQYDFEEILKNISRENLLIICGEKDVFYCDDKFKNYIKAKEIEMIEVAGVGHDWHEKFDREIEKIIE
jgi:hypothetical protein